MQERKDPSLASILSFLLVGLGQIYCGKVWRGIGLALLTIIGYCLLIIPGIVIHIAVIWDAYKTALDYNKSLEK